MATIAEFIIPTEEFALRETLEQRPDMVFEVDRVVAHATNNVVPYVTATQGEFEGLTSLLENDSSVEDIELLDEAGGERLYRMVWTDRAELLGYMVAEEGATIQRATAQNGQWHLRVLFPDRSGLQAAHNYARENDLPLDLTAVYGIDTQEQARFDLTDAQQEALITAVESGYYGIPREMDQIELAEELGVSHQALSERLRRGVENVVRNALLVDESEMEDPE